MRHNIDTLPEFLAIFIGMFVLIGTMDWAVRRFGGSWLKSMLLTGDDGRYQGYQEPDSALECRLSKLERELKALRRE